MTTTWDAASLLREVLVTPRKGYFPMPDLRAVERPGWMQIITPSFKNGGFNEVSLSVMSDDEADAVLDATIAEYRNLGIRFRWSVVPESRPLDLAERLERRGLSKRYVRGMARPIDAAFIDAGGAHRAGDVRVEEVDARTVATFTDVMARGWQIDPAALRRAHDFLFAIPESERIHRLFVAYRDGEPAGVASYIAFPRSAYLLGAVVLPAHRNAGLYRALVTARAAHAVARGITLATSHAMDETSAPLLEHLGFSSVCRFAVFSG